MNRHADTSRLILASGSPRRSYLLHRAGIEFDVIPSRFDENSVPQGDPMRHAGVLSRFKAQEVSARYPQRWVLGADTIVMIGGRILGKPQNPAGARAMLEQLSGQTHQDYTGYTICRFDSKNEFTDVVSTDVTFKTLTVSEIDWYINTGEPFDKAGAYAIQGIGTFLVKRINGSYTNVVGLPVCEVVEYLLKERIVPIPFGPRIDNFIETGCNQ